MQRGRVSTIIYNFQTRVEGDTTTGPETELSELYAGGVCQFPLHDHDDSTYLMPDMSKTGRGCPCSHGLLRSSRLSTREMMMVAGKVCQFLKTSLCQSPQQSIVLLVDDVPAKEISHSRPIIECEVRQF